MAHLFDPVLAVHTSLIEALPHQITGVYGEMLPRRPLRFLLADEAILTTDTDVLTHLAHRFPSLEEGEIDAVVAELRRLLQEAFADAEEANPDKRTIRLTLR